MNVKEYKDKVKEEIFYKTNKELIQRFLNDRSAENIGKKRRDKYCTTLDTMSVYLKKDFKEANLTDLKELMRLINDSDYAIESKKDFKVILRMFYRWLNKSELVDWIKPYTNNKLKRRLPESLLTQEDVKKLVENSYNSRNKALIFLLYESGIRCGELISLKIKNFMPDKYGATIIVDGKTGMRRVRLRDCVGYVQKWLNEHPNQDKENYLFVTKHKNPLDYGTLHKILCFAKERAGIKKPCNPHAFRHARATFLSQFLTEQELKVYFGWEASSKMASVYIHLSGAQIDSSLLSKVYNVKEIKQEIKEENKLKRKECTRCGITNNATDVYCGRCGLVLDTQTAINLKSAQEEIAELVKEHIKELEEKLIERFKKNEITT